MLSLRNILYVCIFALVSVSWAHPGHDVRHEAARRSEYLKHNARSLTSCAQQLKSRSNEEAFLKRRQELVQNLRQKRGLESNSGVTGRNVESVFRTSHRSSRSGISLATASEDLFSDNSSCILQPEATEGPYYISNELIRRNIREGEDGIPLILDIRILDTTTCEPMPAVYLDIWHCNATGVYSGVIANGNGDPSDSRNLKNNAFRGVQKTDNAGFAQFETIFPGHYIGRANHIHILTHAKTGPISSANILASHIGQIYFDQSLQAKVEAHEPYAANPQTLTSNAEDLLLASEVDVYDPIVRYVFLGDRVTDGILGWISIGIDPAELQIANARGTYRNGKGVSGEIADLIESKAGNDAVDESAAATGSRPASQG